MAVNVSIQNAMFCNRIYSSSGWIKASMHCLSMMYMYCMRVMIQHLTNLQLMTNLCQLVILYTLSVLLYCKALRHWRANINGAFPLPSVIHWVVDEKTLRLGHCCVYPLVSWYILVMVGWQEGHLACRKPIPLVSRGSVPEQMEELYLCGNQLEKPLIRSSSRVLS